MRELMTGIYRLIQSRCSAIGFLVYKRIQSLLPQGSEKYSTGWWDIIDAPLGLEPSRYGRCTREDDHGGKPIN